MACFRFHGPPQAHSVDDEGTRRVGQRTKYVSYRAGNRVAILRNNCLQ